MTGQYAHSIDAKGRLFIPAALRRELGQTFHVTMGQDHCLSVYSDESWAAFMDKLKALSYNEVKKLRALFAYAADCEPDAQGRILLPATLRESAGLPQEGEGGASFARVGDSNHPRGRAASTGRRSGMPGAGQRWRARPLTPASWRAPWRKWGCEPYV